MPAVVKGTLCQLVAGPVNSKPKWQAWSPGAFELPAVTSPYESYGLAATDAEADDPLAVVTYGYLRGVTPMNSETWAEGEHLWAKNDGTLTHTRPAAPLPQVFCAVVMEDEGSTFGLDVYVRPIPSLGELSGVARETPENKDVFIYNPTTHSWEPRMLDWKDLQPRCHITVQATLRATIEGPLPVRRWLWLMGD